MSEQDLLARRDQERGGTVARLAAVRPNGLPAGNDVLRTRPRRSRRWVPALVLAILGAVVSMALALLQPGVPKVDRSSVWLSEVEFGDLHRNVSGPGNLVSTKTRWVTAVMPARVEEILIEPGQYVEAGDVLIRLQNSDTELAAVLAQSDVAEATAELASLRARLDQESLGQQAAIARAQEDSAIAERDAEVLGKLHDQDIVPSTEYAEKVTKAESRRHVLELEKQRLASTRRGRQSQLGSFETRVERLEAVASVRDAQLDALVVRAKHSGVVAEVRVEPGQWVAQGDVLARIVDPTRLEAQLRIPEIAAKDVLQGQPVRLDTRIGFVDGEVSRVDPSSRDGTVTVDVSLLGALPEGARPDLAVTGEIEVAVVAGVLHTRRPPDVQAGSVGRLFRLDEDGQTATRVQVEFGETSSDRIEIRSGLAAGDTIIVSDTERWSGYDQIELK